MVLPYIARHSRPDRKPEMMKKKCISFLFAIVALNLCSAANAFTIDEYRNAIRKNGGKQAVEMYVIGVGQGIFWSSVYSKSVLGRSPIFCPPGDLTITGEIILSIVNSGLKKTSMSGDQPIELFVVTELRQVFPC